MPQNTASITAEQDRLLEASRGILEVAQNEGRELSATERAEIATNSAKFDELEAERVAISAVAEMTASAGRRTEPAPVNGRNPSQDGADERGFARPLHGSPSYGRLFGMAAATGLDGWSNAGEFLRNIALGRSDNRLRASADSESGQAGGFTVPGVLAAAIFDESLRQELVRPLAKIYNLTSSNLSVAGLDTEDMSTRGKVGGLAMQMVSELADADDQTPVFRTLLFIAKRQCFIAVLQSSWSRTASTSPKN